MILLAPKFAVVLSVDQFGADGEVVGLLGHAAGENRPHVKLAGDGRRINVLPFVAISGYQGDHFELGQLRECADEALRDALTKVFRAGITTGVDEGEDGKRTD